VGGRGMKKIEMDDEVGMNDEMSMMIMLLNKDLEA
jgi:hypothetical protein